MKRELEPYQMIERSIIKKYRKELWTPFIVAVKRYELVQEGDKIAVCISGGKDSMLMAKLMQELQKHSDVPFELVFLVMDPGYNEINRQKIESNAELLHIPVTIFESNIFSVANNTDKNPCYLCARMRRGHLYSKAKELGCNKIALGHHYDDVIETILMGMLYGAQIQTMMPQLQRLPVTRAMFFTSRQITQRRLTQVSSTMLPQPQKLLLLPAKKASARAAAWPPSPSAIMIWV